MCNTTKQKIASALRQLMAERPFNKITVQNLMTATGMKRQSFYYHFQDTRDVLMWICQQELMDPMAESDLDFSRWICFGLRLLDRDRGFYRRVVLDAYPEFTRMFNDRVMGPRMARLLFGQEQRLDDNQRFTLDFATRSATNLLCEFVNSRKPLNSEISYERIRYTMEIFGVQEHNRDIA